MDARRESLHHARPLGKTPRCWLTLCGLFTASPVSFVPEPSMPPPDGLPGALRPADGRGFQRAVAAFSGALAFGWCDSTWYSAVEAEVYHVHIPDITVRMADGEMGVLPHAASCHTLSGYFRLISSGFHSEFISSTCSSPARQVGYGGQSGEFANGGKSVSRFSSFVVRIPPA